MKKRPLVAALTLFLLCVLGALLSAPADAAGDFTISNGVLTKYSGAGGAVEIPSTVTKIGGSAFSGCKKTLTSVYIPRSVTSIEQHAFNGCTNLTTVEFSSLSDLDSIGAYAFSNCYKLTDITFPRSLSSIGEAAFWECSDLKSVTFPSNCYVTAIQPFTFYSCSSLTSISIPSKVTIIGNGAFRFCSGLESVSLPDDLTSIGEDTFGDSGLTGLTLPGKLTSMGTRAFQDCKYLANVTMKEGATTIGSHAFSGCGRLSRFTIPDSVTTIGGYAFSGCDSLAALTLPAGISKIPDCLFYYSGLTELVIPPSITRVGSGAFSGCSRLDRVVFLGGRTTFANSNTIFSFTDNVTVYGPKDSSAQSYCSANKVPFAELESTFHFDLVTPEPFPDGTDVTLEASVTSDVLPLTHILVEVRSVETGQTELSTGGNLNSVSSFDIAQAPAINEYLDLGSLAPGRYAVRYSITTQYDMKFQKSTQNFTITPSYCTLNGHTSTGDPPHGDGTGHPHPLYLTCTQCGRDYFLKNLDTWTDWEIITEPGCFTKGQRQRRCIAVGCSFVEKEDIPAVGSHDWGEQKRTPATCLSEGSVYQECSRCGVTRKLSTIQVLEHNYVPDYSDPVQVVYTCVNGCRQTVLSQHGVVGTALEGLLAGTGTGTRLRSWSVTREGLVTFNEEDLAGEDRIFVVCYDEGGAFLGAQLITSSTSGSGNTAQIDPRAHTVKFFWLNKLLAPQSACQIVWDGYGE